MYEALYMELLKLKRSKIILLLPAGVLFVVILKVISLLGKNDSPQNSWCGTFRDLGVNDYQGILTVMICIFITYIFAREYQQDTASSIFTCPFSRTKVFLGKIAAVLLFIIVIMTLVFMSVLFIGFLIIHKSPESDFLFDQFKILIWMMLLHFSFSMIYSLVSILSKNYIATCVIAAVLIIGSGWACRGLSNDSPPWYVLYPCTGPMYDSFVKYSYTLPYTTFLALIFIIPFIFCITYYSKSNVYGG